MSKELLIRDFNSVGSKQIFFNEEVHKYTDNANNPYLSVTQLIEKYKQPFNRTGIAKRCSKKPSSMYYRWKVKDILEYWDELTITAQDNGNIKHHFLETTIKKSTGYALVGDNLYINSRIHTVEEALKHRYGELDLDFFITTGVAERYPVIFSIIKKMVDKGYRIFAEIGTYSYKYLISGLIDVLFVKGTDFVILDWKTNIDKLSYESGYYVKDKKGNRTDEWIANNIYMKYPVHFLQQSHGNEYSLQLSLYGWLTEQVGLKLAAIILCHIRTLEDGSEVVDVHEIEYKKKEALSLILDYTKTKKSRNIQSKLFN